MPEKMVQRTIVKYLELQPALRGLWFHPPNERTERTQRLQLKGLGVVPGVPDLIICLARGAYHGLAIELKAPAGRLTYAQRAWLQRLEAAGWAAGCCRGVDEALTLVDEYMALRGALRLDPGPYHRFR